MAKKLVILEFEVDQILEPADLLNAVEDAKELAVHEIDRQLDRIGNGKGSAAGEVTVRYQNFGRVNWVSRNGGIYKMIRRRN